MAITATIYVNLLHKALLSLPVEEECLAVFLSLFLGGRGGGWVACDSFGLQDARSRVYSPP